MAFPTWDPATAAVVTLSGGNLVVTSNSTATNQGAHVDAASGGKTAGKYYFEVTLSTNVSIGGNNGVGVGTTASTYTAMGNNSTTGNMAFASGNLFISGSNAGVNIGTFATGQIVGVAIDLDNRRSWFRKSPSGNWNNSGTANPATNTGGIVLPAGTMVPFVTFNQAGNTWTANFGATAFTGAVPSGFSAGWGDELAITAAYVKYNDFSEQLHRGKHDFGTHTFKIALTNTAPDAATHRSLSDITEITAGNGYTAGGAATTISLSRTGGTTTISATDTTITASGGSIASFRYAVLYNDSMTSPPDGLISYWDCGATQTVATGQSLVVDFSPVVFTHT